ncbi:unnamed protein product [Dovyalis caffra]|uniref:Cytochrome P450 n=1 Tax=Dovyalis caffra TaxID=77055 RepID=A0AAV1SMM4_9ROSI|nr:unnamed protein product [Dovyalis caffra]
MLPGLLFKAPNIHEYATQLLKQNGGTFEFKGPWFANMNILLTCDPLNVRHISTKNFVNYPKGPQYKKIFEPFRDGVLNSDFETWKSFRKMIQSMIKDNKFQVFLERSLREKIVKGLIPVLEHVSRQEIELDMQDSLSVDLPEIAYKTAFDDVEEAVFYRHIVPQSIWKLQKWLNVGEEKKLSLAMDIIDNFLEQCISSKKEEIRKTQSPNAICETLRLYPAVPFNYRVSVEADTLPSGHQPERWISERGGIIHVPSYKFIAFNTGPRSCLGKEITFIQMKTIATAILLNYHLQVVESHPISPGLSVMMHMKHGMKVRVTKRRV